MLGIESIKNVEMSYAVELFEYAVLTLYVPRSIFGRIHTTVYYKTFSTA